MTSSVRRAALFASSLALAVALAGCGDDSAGDSSPKESPDSPSAQADPAVDALAAAFTEIDAGLFTDEEADCLGSTLLEQAGADRLVAWKVLDADHEKAELRDDPKEFVDARSRAISACVGLLDFGFRTMRSFQESAATSPAEKAKVADDEYWAALTACAERAVPEDEVLAATLDDASTAMQERVEKVFADCDREAAAD